MGEKERLKELRKTLGLTLEKFGERIGLKKAVLSEYENGRKSMTPRTKLAICREFGVSEEWLESGNGEMFKTDTEEGQRLKELIDRHLSDSDDKFRSALLEVILRLDEAQIEAVKSYAVKYLLPAMEPKDGHLSKAANDGEPTIEEKVEAYRQALLEEEEMKEKGEAG